VSPAAEPQLLDDAACAAWLPIRPPRGHKGSNGRLVCVCGSLDYAGAALLSVSAAARAGTGLVTLAVPASLQPIVAGRVPEVVTLGLPEGDDGIDVDEALGLIAAREPTALLVGPGLRETADYGRLLTRLLAGEGDPGEATGDASGAPMVVDGGALSMLARAGSWWTDVRRACVLTPHPGEFARLTGAPVGDDDDERTARAKEAAARFGHVVVLKGAGTVIADPDGRLARAPFVNPALSTAGTGDVLAGTIGALLAQGVAPFEAAALGVYLHGAAADRTRERLGDSGLLASDLPFEIAVVRHRLAQLRDRPNAGRVGISRR
jgi:ADP-dependent NAD(P)H-hydrate dehydratase / NAD(P)H-hydrate epimerase